MTTVHLDSELRKHQIVHTARKIVATKGMAFFTIQELAREVGVSEGAIYRHFKSKDDILLVLIQDIERNLLDAVSDSARPQEGSMDQMKHLFRRHFSSLERRSGISFVVVAEALRFGDTQVKEATSQVVERYLNMIDSILKAGVQGGEIDKDVDTRAAALMFFGMVQASVTLWSFNSRAHPLAQHSASLWSIFEVGLTQRGQNHIRESYSPAAGNSAVQGDASSPARG